MTPLQTSAVSLLDQLKKIVLDKEVASKLALACILAGGHLLLQDLPGMGKTTLANALAKGLGLDFNRVQFTNDMLPADILGMVIYNQKEHSFEFRKGAVFTQVLLADEINRTSPKTQSALLEAMEEKQVSQDGQTHRLPKPFFVIATQNPAQQSGVYPLPESQLDRFMMCLSLGYPSLRAERELLQGIDRRAMVADMPSILNAEQVLAIQQEVKAVHLSEPSLDYLQALVAKTRQSPHYHGLSPRGVLALKHASQAYAYLSGHDNVAIDDIQAVFGAVANHRLGQRFTPVLYQSDELPTTLADEVLNAVSVMHPH